MECWGWVLVGSKSTYPWFSSERSTVLHLVPERIFRKYYPERPCKYYPEIFTKMS